MHESVLVYRGFKYLKWAVILMAASIVGYAVHEPLPVPNGGTELGYVLGTIGAVLILWLMWFGVRKRSYSGGNVKLEGWLSAHVYLGGALILVATLHTGFQFNWNIHTLAYALMMVVILSGFYGVYAYFRYPTLMTENMHGDTIDGILESISDIDATAQELAKKLPDEVNSAVQAGIQKSRLGGGFLAQLSASDRNCAARKALDAVAAYAAANPGGSDAAALTKMISMLSRKVELMTKARQDIQMRAKMNIWLYFHVPLSFALLATLSAHIFSVFFYW